MPFSTNHSPLPKLLCDENLPKKLVELLKEKGLEVKDAPVGASDNEVAALAKSEQRVIVTFDKHFATRWLYPPEEYCGIVFLKIRPPLLKTAASALLNLFNSVSSEEFNGRLFVVSEIGFRIWPKYPKD